MITIQLEIASNGIIKTVIDNNYNGAGAGLETRTVYETDDDPRFSNTSKFLYNICDDLGVNLGNKFDNNVLNFDVSWGSHYEPEVEELDSFIKELTAELKNLKQLKNDILEIENKNTK
jgi:hypothetical protein